MSEKGMILNSEQVRAILDGSKTQDRRPLKFKDPSDKCCWCEGVGFEYVDCGNELSDYDYRRPCRCKFPKKRYQVGDEIYVKETWCNINKSKFNPEIYYKASAIEAEDYDSQEWSWRSPVIMPKEFARIWLKVTGVRFELDEGIWYEIAEFTRIKK